MTPQSEIANEKRPISAVYWDDVENTSFRVCGKQVTGIEAYDDYGVGDVMPYIRVMKGDDVLCRVPAYKVTVLYKVPEEQ